jgi:hypothetical protein
VGAIRKVIGVGAVYRNRMSRVMIHVEEWDGKYQTIVLFNVAV